MLVSIIIPAYNEEQRLRLSLKKIGGYIAKQKNYHFEVIVVSDGSKDRTVDVAMEFPFVRVVEYIVNKGKGYALREGVKYARGKWFYICDADLSSPIEELDKFLEHIESDYDCIIGSRALEGGQEHNSVFRRFLGRFGNRLIKIFLGLKIEDTQCGFKLFDIKCRDIFLKLTIDRWGYDFEFLYLLEQQDLKIKEIPIHWEAVDGSKMDIQGYFMTFLELITVWQKYVGFSREFLVRLYKFGR